MVDSFSLERLYCRPLTEPFTTPPVTQHLSLPCLRASVSPPVNGDQCDKEVRSGEAAWFSHGATSGFQDPFLEEGSRVGWKAFWGLELRSPGSRSTCDLRQGPCPPQPSLPIPDKERGPPSSRGLCMVQSQNRNPGLLEPSPRGGTHCTFPCS